MRGNTEVGGTAAAVVREGGPPLVHGLSPNGGDAARDRGAGAVAVRVADDRAVVQGVRRDGVDDLGDAGSASPPGLGLAQGRAAGLGPRPADPPLPAAPPGAGQTLKPEQP